MKLSLFHHGYQGKHERGQIPRQRESDDDAPRGASGPRGADEREAQEEQGDVTLVSRQPSAADQPAESLQSRSPGPSGPRVLPKPGEAPTLER